MTHPDLIPGPIEVHLVQNPTHMGYDLYIGQQVGPDTYRDALPIEIQWGEPHGMYSINTTGPVCVIPRHVLRKMLNDLDERGTRPKNQDRIDGELEATKLHLADMQGMTKGMLAKMLGSLTASSHLKEDKI